MPSFTQIPLSKSDEPLQLSTDENGELDVLTIGVTDFGTYMHVEDDSLFSGLAVDALGSSIEGQVRVDFTAPAVSILDKRDRA